MLVQIAVATSDDENGVARLTAMVDPHTYRSCFACMSLRGYGIVLPTSEETRTLITSGGGTGPAKPGNRLDDTRKVPMPPAHDAGR